MLTDDQSGLNASLWPERCRLPLRGHPQPKGHSGYNMSVCTAAIEKGPYQRAVVEPSVSTENIAVTTLLELSKAKQRERKAGQPTLTSSLVIAASPQSFVYLDSAARFVLWDKASRSADRTRCNARIAMIPVRDSSTMVIPRR